MTQFEASLRRGLMDANIAQYEYTIRKMESRELDVSPKYCRERMRLLADPWNWAKQRAGIRRKYLNWRLIAVIAVLLLLSACAYAVVTGQFAQWFPTMRMDPEAPEVSEEIVSRMGTVVGQSQTVDDVTVTLNAAVWDGQSLSISLTAEGADLPELASTVLYDAESYIRLAEDQREPYLRRQIAEAHAASHTDISEEKLEEMVQADLKRPDQPNLHPYVAITGQEGDTLTLEVGLALYPYVEKPELTLHIENLAACKQPEDGVYGTMILPDGTIETNYELDVTVLRGPYDFSLTLDELTAPVCYEADLDITYENIPLHVSKITLTPFEARADYEVMAQVDMSHENPDPNKLNISFEQNLAMSINGLWLEDGTFMETMGGTTMSNTPDGRADGEMISPLIHLIDPKTVTAMKIGGTRVELDKLNRLSE